MPNPYGQASVLAADWTARVNSLFAWNYLHQGGRWDSDTGLYAFRHRDYSPTLGRWIEQDPMGYDAGDRNLYRYVGNEPVSNLDPTGLVTVVMELYYNAWAANNYGLPIEAAVRGETNRVLRDAVRRFVAPGSSLRIVWFGLSTPGAFDAQPVGWVSSPSYTFGEGFAAGILSTFGGVPGAVYCLSQLSRPPENLTVRLKINVFPVRGFLVATDAFGHGEGFQIELFRDGIWKEFDLRPDTPRNLTLGDTIAHEIVHALGGGHGPPGFIDSSPMPRSGLGKVGYSDDGARYVVKKLKLPLR